MPGINVSLFSQILKLIDRNRCQDQIKKHGTDKHSKGINTWTHLVSMIFCHISKAGSLREISNGLRSVTGNLNHLGINKAPSKSSLSYLNGTRDWRVFRDIYFVLLDHLESSVKIKRQYATRLKRKIFILDSTIISLSLEIFDWALYRQQKGAMKLHTILDYDTRLPVFVQMTDGKKHDVQVGKTLALPVGSVLVMDRAYVDFNWLNDLDSRGVFFVTRLKNNADYKVAEQFITDERKDYILDDQDIELTGFYTQKKYPEKLRLVRVYDEENDNYLILVTNNFSWTAETISQLYKARWEIEVFFKQLKQVLKIKTFVGTSPNAVMIQVWTAMITMLLLKYLKEKAKFGWHLSNLAAFLRMNLFVKIELWQWLNHPFIKIRAPGEQLPLFEN